MSMKDEEKKHDQAQETLEQQSLIMKTVRTITELRLFMLRNKRPIYFISATNFNLMGIDEWVGNFTSICYIDCYDGRHPNVFVPPKSPVSNPRASRTSTTTCSSTRR
ncbi:hypothetical protein [Rhizobium leguminosarum]|uniref:hypothetical protein n=1 Tax=Rhizobium leguminosarum TaxID=384 RepID=UPI0021BC05BB|nr:hypothetical protein [Rhizobium leguminosarum]